jgi:hypothetical protein
VVSGKMPKGPVNNILIVNTYFGTQYSFMLLKSCRDTI